MQVWTSRSQQLAVLQPQVRGGVATYQSCTGAAVPGTWKLWVIEKFELLHETAEILRWMQMGCSS